MKHPQVEFYQCTSMNYFDDVFSKNATETFVTSEQAEKMYSMLFLVVVYVIPLSVIIITYANILNKIFRNTSSGDSRHVVVSCSLRLLST